MKKIILAAAVAAVASLAVASFASADVTRYQTQSMTITAVQPKDTVGQFNDVWTHTYTLTLNPCDGSFTGSGSVSGTPSASDPRGPLGTETITGQRNSDGSISYTATRDDSGEVYSLTNAKLDGTTEALATSNPVVSFPVTFHVNATTTAKTNYKNHGEYVSSRGGDDDAAHSCIGMPVR